MATAREIAEAAFKYAQAVEAKRKVVVGVNEYLEDDGPPVEPAEIVEWARGEMANYKAPRTVEILDALPLNATGKVVKSRLHAALVKLQESWSVSPSMGEV